MNIYADALALFQLPEIDWAPVKVPKPRRDQGSRRRPLSIVKRELKRQETLCKCKGQKPLSAIGGGGVGRAVYGTADGDGQV